MADVSTGYSNGPGGYYKVDDRSGPYTISSAGTAALVGGGSSGALAAGENVIGKTVGIAAVVSANFTRPADTTQYAVGDGVSNSTTAGSVVPMSFVVARVAAGSGMVRRVRVSKTGTSIASATYRLHLYNASPVSANGDNGAWSTDKAANYIGSLDISVERAFTDGASGVGEPNNGSELNFSLTSGQTIYGLLEARATYTPVSAEVFTVALEVLQN